MNAIDKVIAIVSPSWGAKRAAARAKIERETLAASSVRGFNAVSKGRRANDWNTHSDTGATSPIHDIDELRKRAQQMDKNNPYWKCAKRALGGLIVGHGIRCTVVHPNKRVGSTLQDSWDAWAKSRQADSSRRLSWYGIQKLVIRHVINDGECLIRKVPKGGALSLQVLGCEYLCKAKDGASGNAQIVGGIELDEYGEAVAYHLFKRHPSLGGTDTVRVPAAEIAHVYDVERANQYRGESWIACVFTRLADWDDYEDADLLRQKIAACFGVVYKGANPPDPDYQPLDKIEPGTVEYLPAGVEMTTITPPASNGGLRDTGLIVHRAIAAGLGITYEAMTGDYTGVNFSSGRLGHLRQAANVRDWQQHMVIPMLCERVLDWFLELETLKPGGDARPAKITATWTVPARDLIDPEKETLANIKRVRAGFTSWSDVVLESGRDPYEVLEQLKRDGDEFDKRGLVLDIDARKVSAQGQGSINQKQEGADSGSEDKAA